MEMSHHAAPGTAKQLPAPAVCVRADRPRGGRSRFAVPATVAAGALGFFFAFAGASALARPSAPGGAGSDPAAAIPLSAVFAPAPSPSPAPPPAEPTPLSYDPFGPAVSLPRPFLAPTPTPPPTPRPSPAATLPPEFSRQGLYLSPREMERRRPPEPFFKEEPGLLPEREMETAEIQIENRWLNLCVELRLIPAREEPPPGAAPAPAPSPPREPVVLLYPPGQSARFRLPAGRWRVERLAWLPAAPYPGERNEYPAQEFLARTLYTATLEEEEERSLVEDFEALARDWAEKRARANPLSLLGLPREPQDDSARP